jgi:hypothetical protein
MSRTSRFSQMYASHIHQRIEALAAADDPRSQRHKDTKMRTADAIDRITQLACALPPNEQAAVKAVLLDETARAAATILADVRRRVEHTSAPPMACR